MARPAEQRRTLPPTGAAMGAGLPLLLASEEEALMREAGFANVELFYSAFSFMCWVAKA
ncbi:hypothetical protein [Rhizobium sp. 11_C7_N12_5]|uniref:hypothetical protein n=1 Tax=Rhizobium sp. 11_C7_N12_5 TaxID=3240770 RepID=UPI003F243711